jgi:ArsR family transcriptional regulator
MADKFRMLSDPTRLAILRSLMAQGEQNVSQLVSATGRSVANISKHLKLLADAGLLARQKQGSFVLYRLDDPLVAKMCELVCDSLKREFETQLQRNRRLLRKQNRT